MKSFLPLLITALFGSFSYAQEEAADSFSLSEAQLKTAQSLIEQALESDLAFEIVESLTTEVGPRLAGSESEQRARDWGVKLGKKLSFDKVSVEEFTMPYWTRGEMSISMTSPYTQELYGTALGLSLIHI